MAPTNIFLSDKNERGINPLAGFTEQQKANLLDILLKDAPVGKEIDLSKPVVKPYNPRDPKNQFPRMVYNHENGHTLIVKNAREQQAAQKKGYQLEAGENWDYSKLPNGFASPKVHAVREEVLTVDDLDEDDGEESS